MAVGVIGVKFYPSSIVVDNFLSLGLKMRVLDEVGVQNDIVIHHIHYPIFFHHSIHNILNTSQSLLVT